MGRVQKSCGSIVVKKIKLIAETAWHHDGEFSFMEHLLDTILNQSKADVVKMHVTLDFDEYMDSSHSIYNVYSKI